MKYLHRLTKLVAKACAIRIVIFVSKNTVIYANVVALRATRTQFRNPDHVSYFTPELKTAPQCAFMRLLHGTASTL